MTAPVVKPTKKTAAKRAPHKATSQQQDAARAATTREQRCDEMRNEDIRRVVEMLDGTAETRNRAMSLMLLTVFGQCQMLGIQGPTLLVGVAP